VNFSARGLLGAMAAIVLAGSLAACVTPAARVPCDGRLEPINSPAKKPASSNSRAESTTKVSP
jgi:hypothetical protein